MSVLCAYSNRGVLKWAIWSIYKHNTRSTVKIWVRVEHPGIQVNLCCVIDGEDRTPRYTGDLVLCYRWRGWDTQVYR